MAPPFPSDPKATPKSKPVKEQLRESVVRTQAFWDNSPNPIFLKDEELRYLYVNREFERALRVDHEQIRGKKDPRVSLSPQNCSTTKREPLQGQRSNVWAALNWPEAAPSSSMKSEPHLRRDASASTRNSAKEL
jgi:PAS domain-containing protein